MSCASLPNSPSLVRTLLFITLLSGCYVSHLRDDAGAPYGGTVRDAGDASVPRDAPLRVDAFPLPDAGSCGGGGGVVVRVEPVTRETMRCFVGHAEGVAVLGVDAAPDDFGIRIHADLCPDADADCRCDFVVANVGIGLEKPTLRPVWKMGYRPKGVDGILI